MKKKFNFKMDGKTFKGSYHDIVKQGYYTSPTYLKKRQRRIEIDRGKCRICGETQNLHVHHVYDCYDKIPNESIHYDLITLCERCHHLFHKYNIKPTDYDSIRNLDPGLEKDVTFVVRDFEEEKIDFYQLLKEGKT